MYVKRRYIFYGHSGSENHGCEAIIRTSTNILGQSPILYSMNPYQDNKYGLSNVVDKLEIDEDEKIKKYSSSWVKAAFHAKLRGSVEKEIYYRKQKMIDSAREGDIWFSAGGDNYCYSGTEILAAENSLIKKHGAKTVLWGCSVEPELLKQKSIVNDMKKYNLITARESISYDALSEINPNTVLVSDPAFTLKKIELPLPDGWKMNNMIGINVSPLILQSAQESQMALASYKNLIDEILCNTDYGIVLIPHVVCNNNDDRVPLRKLYNQYHMNDRIAMISDCNCMELKGYIARCRVFVGARTHATIAAYSSCVPTLVLGYSVKSKGIAKDLFGTDQNYVLPVQNLHNEFDLVNAFKWILDNEDEIRQHLQQIIPDYIKNAYNLKVGKPALKSPAAGDSSNPQ